MYESQFEDCLLLDQMFFNKKTGYGRQLQKYIIYEDVKKQGYKYGTLRDGLSNFSPFRKTVSDLTSLFSVVK